MRQEMPQYQVGQRWSYHGRSEDQGSTLVIGAVQTNPAIIYVTVEGVMLPNGSQASSISHMPFSEEAIDQSVIELLAEGVASGLSFEEGLTQWQTDKGGYFSVSVAEAIATIMTATQPASPDPFDVLVQKMQGGRSPELVGELYRNL